MTAATARGLERPPLTLDVKLESGDDHKIKLSYGLFQDLQRLIPDPASIVDTVTSDPYTRDYVIRRCMTPLKKMVTKIDEELIPAEEMPIDDPDELDKILQWVVGHMLYFFATSAGGLKQLGEVFQDNLSLTTVPPAPSTAGSET